MTKLLIDAQTGTILQVEHCFIVETDDLDEDQDTILESGSDTEISDLARATGISLKEMGQDTGWGDNKYAFTVSYSPKSIRDEAFAMLDNHIYEPEDEHYHVVKWTAYEATDEQLAEVGAMICGSDATWDDYTNNIMGDLVFAYSRHLDAVLSKG